jgi:hypothetical protein
MPLHASRYKVIITSEDKGQVIFLIIYILDAFAVEMEAFRVREPLINK